jgi:AraC family transcriptional regulator
MKHTEPPSLMGEYQSRINRVMDYMEANLAETHTLEELANVALFSKYHFHRIFQAMTGETPFQFLTRLRTAKAASLLRYSPSLTISEMGYQCGFSSPALFSRTFRQYFGVAPGEWRKREKSVDRSMNDRHNKTRSNLDQPDSNLRQIHSNSRQAGEEVSMYICPEFKTLKWRTNMKLNKSMEVKELPKMTVAYIRHTGPYQGNSQLFGKLIGELCTWAGPRGLLQHNDMGIIIFYHDDPKVTEQDKLRMSVSIKVPENTKVDGKVGKMEVPAGTYAVGRFEVESHEFPEAWGWMYGTWLPQSGYQPDDGPCFEVYPEEHKPGEKMKVDICVPVKPL